MRVKWMGQEERKQFIGSTLCESIAEYGSRRCQRTEQNNFTQFLFPFERTLSITLHSNSLFLDFNLNIICSTKMAYDLCIFCPRTILTIFHPLECTRKDYIIYFNTWYVGKCVSLVNILDVYIVSTLLIIINDIGQLNRWGCGFGSTGIGFTPSFPSTIHILIISNLFSTIWKVL